MAKSFDREKYSRNRVVGWDETANGGKGAPVTTDDVVDEKTGNPRPDLLSKYGIDETEVYRITPKTMGEPFTSGNGAEMLEAYTKLTAGPDDTADDVLVQLVLQAHGTYSYNQSLARFRPKSQAVVDKSFLIVAEALGIEVAGKSGEEIKAAVLAISGRK